ncbi:MAG: DUF935 domain-containing protein [Candidatus Accumulibacter sp.]|jgi:phage gp29-like protein|nr:DUF935 domain-containing protein [Accumulibacter sp.]
MIDFFKAALSAIKRRVPLGRQAEARSAHVAALNYRSVRTLDPSVLARAFAAADQGHIADQAALFELIEEQDAHIAGELSKRRRAVTGLGWHLVPPDDATEAEIARARELEDMIRAIPGFEDAQYDVTDAIGKGFAALEILWQGGDVWLPRALVFVPQRMFEVVNMGERAGEIDYVNNGIPEPLRPCGWILHEHRSKSGYIEQAALFRVLAWTYAYKTYNVHDMQKFLELYGLPLRLGKYPAGPDDKAPEALIRAVRNIGHDGAGVIPNTMEIQFAEAKRTGTVSDFLSAIAYWEHKQSVAILGGTLTSQADGKTSTNALGRIHDKARREILLHDVAQIEPTLSAQLVKPIALVNGIFPEDRIPKFAYLTEETVDQGKMIKVLVDAVGIGMEISLDYAHEVMQIPRAKEGEETLQAAARQAPDEGDAGEKDGDAGGKDGDGKDPDDEDEDPEDGDEDLKRRAALGREKATEASVYAAQMAALCAPFEEKVVAQIAAIVAESSDFDEAIEKIAAMKRDEENYQAWAKTIAEGMAAAHLAGRAEEKDKT